MSGCYHPVQIKNSAGKNIRVCCGVCVGCREMRKELWKKRK